MTIDLLSRVLGSTAGKVTVGGIGYDAVEVVPVPHSYEINDADLAVILASLKAVCVAGIAGDIKMLADVAARLTAQVSK